MNTIKQHISNKNTAITFSITAKNHILKYLNHETLGIRLSLKKSGCSGLSYVIEYNFLPKDNDLILPFDENYKLYIDKDSYPYLKNIHVDYIVENLSAKLTFSNPNQTGECGCGKSFTIN